MDGPQTPFYINVIKRAKQKQRLPTHQEGRGSPYQGGEDCHQPESKILPRDKKAVSPVQEGTEGNLLSRRSFSLIEYPYNVSDNHKSTMKE